jgi:L-aminopeptidase/D-esterase-like protein
MSEYNAITDVPGILVGHYKSEATGTTAILVQGQGAVGGVSVAGAAPGTRETDLLKSGNLVEKVNAIVLSGGSAFGLDSATGVMKYLEEKGIGYSIEGGHVVPIVPAAVLFDLGRGRDWQARPTAEFGYRACLAASSGRPAQGNVGAGTGAVAGGLKGGIGTASAELDKSIVVGAIVAVNSYGSPVNPKTGLPYASYLERGNEFGLAEIGSPPLTEGAEESNPTYLQHTTIGAVATNGSLTKAQANKLAQMAQDGIARAICPAHTMFDGDTIFVLATGEVETVTGKGGPFGEGEGAWLTEIGSAASDVVARAIVHAMLAAESALGFDSYLDRYLSNVNRNKAGPGGNFDRLERRRC